MATISLFPFWENKRLETLLAIPEQWSEQAAYTATLRQEGKRSFLPTSSSQGLLGEFRSSQDRHPTSALGGLDSGHWTHRRIVPVTTLPYSFGREKAGGILPPGEVGWLHKEFFASLPPYCIMRVHCGFVKRVFRSWNVDQRKFFQ